MFKILALIRKDILEQIRTQRLFILAAVFLFLGIASPIFAKLMPEILKGVSLGEGMAIKVPEPTYLDAIDQFIKNTSQIVVLLLIFVVAGAIADEKTKKTLELVLVKPVSRTSFVLSKFLAYFFMIAVFFIISAVVFYLYTVSLFADFDLARFTIVALLSLLYVLLVIAATLFFSTITRNAAMAGIIGFISSITFSSALSALKVTAKWSPGYIIGHYRELILDGWNAVFIKPALMSICIIILLMYLSIFLFQRQEIER